MSGLTNELFAKIKQLSAEEKFQLVDFMLSDLHNPDFENIWAEEAQRRWTAYKAGKIATVSHEQVMSKFQQMKSSSDFNDLGEF